MTDTASPITEPHLTPMFSSGGQPALSPNTEPHPSPIFDTGPHPEPLRSTKYVLSTESPSYTESSSASLEWDSDEWAALGSAAVEAEARAEAEAEAEVGAEVEAEAGAEAGSLSALVYERAPVWDAGVRSEPELARIARGLDSAADADHEPAQTNEHGPKAFSELENVDTDAFLRSVTGHLQPVVVTAQPVVVPSAFQFVKRWKFALILAGVWVLAAAAGLGFYYWWYIAMDKTLPVFGILVYLMVCMVASMLVSMVPDRPQVTALAIALMSAPLASMAAAAVLHGAYFFEWIIRPTIS